VPDVTDEEIAHWTKLTDPKDAHVLAGAAHARVTHLLTLDRVHLLTPKVLSAKLPFMVQTPAEFLNDLRRSLQT
jgi:predicted nucleic acid-binding protein